MTEDTITPTEFPDASTALRQDSGQSLRQRAEDVVQRRSEEMDEIPAGDIRDLIHELRVHQVELEMQNEELRRAQRELERSRDRYSDLYEFAPVGYVTVSEAGTILEANLTAATMLGVERGRLIGQPLSHFIAEDDQDIYYHHRRELFGTQEPQSCEMRMVRGDGRQFWAQIEARASVDSEVVCRATLSDITERKRMEEALRESKARYQQLAESAEAILWEYDVDADRWTYVAPQVTRILGYPPKAWTDLQFWVDHLHPEDREWALLYCLECANRGEPHTFEYRFLKKDGGVVWSRDVVSVEMKDGQPVKLRGFMMDITERKQMEQDLRKSEEEYRVLFESFPLGITVADSSGQVLEANVESERLLGISQDEHQGRYIDGQEWQIIRPDGSPMPAEEYASVRALQENRLIEDVEMGIVKPDEGVTWINVTAAPLMDNRVVITYNDITELKRSNEELEQFAYVISHDLREPARTVKSYLDLLEKRYQGELDEKADVFIDHAVDGAERMQEMIGALLDLSRVGTRGDDPAPTDAEEVLKRVLGSLERAIEDADAEVTYDSLPTVMADEAQLAQVFQNLIANAIKFRREGVPPHVHISAEREGDEWLFSVADNGIGIDPEQADRIFQIFQRLHTREEYEGLGMGLALCKRIVERHDGCIWVESKPGKGSTFYFTLSARET
jgi:PAS domain S-box-containing protein